MSSPCLREQLPRWSLSSYIVEAGFTHRRNVVIGQRQRRSSGGWRIKERTGKFHQQLSGSLQEFRYPLPSIGHEINPGGGTGKHGVLFGRRDEAGYLGSPCAKYFMSIFISLPFNLTALKLGTVTWSGQKGEPGSTSVWHSFD